MKRTRITRTAGLSLIELLVAMAIGLVVTLAVTSVLIRSEGSKRSSTSVNDINQSGAYASYMLDRVIRSAGSGYSQRWRDAYGCLLDVSQGSARVLPIPSAIPTASAFRNLSLNQRLAPVVIDKGAADVGTADVRGDVIVVMGGTAGVGESPQTAISKSVKATELRLPNTLGYQNGDLVLVADPDKMITVDNSCLVQQVRFSAVPAGAVFPTGASQPGGSSDQTLPFAAASAAGISYYGAGGSNVTLGDFETKNITPVIFQLGRDPANPPQFRAYAVGANQTLMGYDLLQPLPTAGAAPDMPVTDGVVEMRAVYGLDTTNPPNGTLDTWVDATGSYAASALTDGSAAALTRLRQIIAVRVGLILRTSLEERSPATSASGVLSAETFGQASGTTLTLFSDLPTALQQTRTLTTAELNYRFRTVEVTIPLRNVLLAP